jgi:hypothetical protein
MEEEIKKRLNEVLEEGRLGSEKYIVRCTYGMSFKIDLEGDEKYWLSQSENPKLYDNLEDVYSKRITDGACPRHYQEEIDNIINFDK